MNRLLFVALSICFFMAITDKHPVLVGSADHMLTKSGARGVLRCTYLGPRGMVEDEYRVTAHVRDAPASCPLMRPRRVTRSA